MNVHLHALLVLFAFLCPAGVCALEYKPQSAEVVSVYDGDTFRLRFPDSKDPETDHGANLIGVDAPGDGEVECDAEYVTFIAQRLLAGKTVWVEWDSRDRQTADGRLLVYISHIDDRSADLNALYIERGWGWVPRKFPADRKHEYLELEQTARAQRRGIWGGNCPPDI
ncbi:MAG: thermonuclease family protein [Gammaproteobacteria bacterium]